MPTRSVVLTDHLDQFIASSIDAGRYSDASEVVREGLRLLESREQGERNHLEALRHAVQKGIDEIERGEGIEFASIDDLADHIHAIGEETFSIDKPEPSRV